MIKLTQKNLEATCAYWQQVLRLQDWDIALSIQRLSVMGDKMMGQCTVVENMREATFKLLDPRDVDGQAFVFKWDWETTLIHELLHLHLNDCNIKWDSSEGIAAERAIDHISKALHRLQHESL